MANENEVKCSARRHMSASAFMTYDAMRACIGNNRGANGLEYWRGPHLLANLNDRNVDSEKSGLKELESLGWIVKLNKGRKRFDVNGRLDPDRYRVLTHEEWMYHEGKRKECPPAKYVHDGERWQLVKHGTAAPGLRRANVRRVFGDALGFELPDLFLDAAAEAGLKRRTCTGNPVQDDPFSPTQENLFKTYTENPVQAYTETPVQGCTGKPVQDLHRKSCELALAASVKQTAPTNQPACQALSETAPKSGGQAGRFVSNAEYVGPSAAPHPSAEPTRTPDLWQQLRAHENFPDIMRTAVPTPEGRRAVLAQLAEIGNDKFGIDALANLIENWVDERSPAIDTLKSYRWGDGPDAEKHAYGWLKESTPAWIAEAKETANYHREREEWNIWEEIDKKHPRRKEFVKWFAQNHLATLERALAIKNKNPNWLWQFDKKELPFAREVRALFEEWLATNVTPDAESGTP
jgi:hypothetical protein